eukprot:4656230-Pyramimonas_sp.AAC.1
MRSLLQSRRWRTVVGTLADTRARNDPTRARRIGQHPGILHNSVENEHLVGIAEYVGRSLAKNASSQSVCIAAI